MENLRQRTDVRLISNMEHAERILRKSNVASFNIINEELCIVTLQRTKLFWNRPTYVGFMVLELSKLHMARFHYGAIRVQFGE